MRFVLVSIFTLLTGCPAPVQETNHEDGGITIPDAGDPTRCDTGQTLCGEEGSRVCAFLESDEDNCGTCGNVCEDPVTSTTGWTCNQGACSCNTLGPAHLCAGGPTATCCNDRTGVDCFDLTTSNDHCGSCQNACADPEVADHCEASTCVCGNLGRACAGSLESTCCIDGGDPATARCAHLLNGGSDVASGENDCGACGIQCPADPGAPDGDHCSQGQCVCGPGTPETPAAPCPDGTICCGTGDTALCAPPGSCG
jgi:hypothetical protein